MTDTPAADLRFGRWEDVLQGVECDALIVDAPYSERTHAGHNERIAAAVSAGVRGDGRPYTVGLGRRSELHYAAWTGDDVRAFVDAWSPRTRGWFCTITDHVLADHWATALELAGRYVFSPIACVTPGGRVRLTGDGPAQWACWLIVARPRSPVFMKWGALPGAYVVPAGHNDRKNGVSVTGGKPLWLMRSLVRDYSRPGDLVCDPCAGGATTLLAAVTEGRRAVGAEQDPAHFEIAQRRLSRGYTPALFAE